MRGWTCRCQWKNEPAKRTCAMCGKKRPPKRKQPHMKALDNSYEAFREFNAEVHGPAFGPEWQPDDCGACGKKPKDLAVRKHDRDHGHRKNEHSYGKMRGLLCPGDSGCNMLLKGLTAERVQQLADYVGRAEMENAA